MDQDQVKGKGTGALREEVRLAMAWNGGVSLAIWMGGVAVELDAARRKATRLYAAICDAFDRELVIDILSGASAGGLNGALIAASIQHDEPLEPEFLRTRWLEIGDFGELLQPRTEAEPKSLMQGERFYELLEGVFQSLLKDKEDPDDLSPAKVFLDVQVTDTEGAERSFYDSWQQPFYAREYRSPIRFRIGADYDPETLATAARASASFPGAFESQELLGTPARLAGFPGQNRWAVDGGLLENAPIRPALELIPTRPASGPVKRFLCYVNAAPPVHVKDKAKSEQPDLGKVLSYVVNLPREGRTIDQLYAMDNASRRAGLTSSCGLHLLDLEADQLKPAAQALLPAYQRRRALLSLEELLAGVTQRAVPEAAAQVEETPSDGMSAGPGLAARVLRSLADPSDLPWIPASIDAPDRPERWAWGIRPAQRVLQLALDVLLKAVESTDEPEAAKEILRARGRIYSSVLELDRMHEHFMDPQGEVGEAARDLRGGPKERARALERLTCLSVGRSVTIWCVFEPAVEAFYKAMHRLPNDVEKVPNADHLFGGVTPFGFDACRALLNLALPIEVIRRTFSDDLDIESAKELHIAQLTPLAHTPLFARKPEEQTGPCTPEEKLTGIRWGHFAAFYRSSWRANDFMWGRMDGAAQTVRLLVDGERARRVSAHDGRNPSADLALALVPEGDDERDRERRRLVWEVLNAGPDEVEGDHDAEELRLELGERLEADLLGRGDLACIVCTRALQYEILSEEEAHLFAQLDEDRAAGAFCASLEWEHHEDSSWEAIKCLRTPKQTLPQQLGRDDWDEKTSGLALGRLSHAAVVAVSALTGVVPLARFLQPIRLPMFAVAGVVARPLLDRIAVVFAFTGAVWYAVARLVALPTDAARVPIDALWSPEVLAFWVSLLVVVGVALVPLVRGVKTENRRRRGQELGVFAALLATGGAGALLWAWIRTGSGSQALTAYRAGSDSKPPDELLLLVVGAAGVQAAALSEKVSSLVPSLVGKLLDLLKIQSRSAFLPLFAIGVGGTLAGFSLANTLAPALDDWFWKTVMVLLAIASPIVLALMLRILPVALRGLRKLWDRLRGHTPAVEPVPVIDRAP